jgi:hypothetical protein
MNCCEIKCYKKITDDDGILQLVILIFENERERERGGMKCRGNTSLHGESS